MDKVLVQIGLHHTCEYLYVSQPDLSAEPGFGLPNDVYEEGGELWEYYGVEMKPANMNEVLIPQFGYLDRVYLLQETIYHTSGVTEVPSLYIKPSGTITLIDLFDKTGVPDVLVMDIENAEYPVLEFHDWSLKPKCIIVECHSLETSHKIVGLLNLLDYVLIGMELLEGDLFLRDNLTFLHRDAVSNERLAEYATADTELFWHLY